jgi:carboxymethylenebutenolidase
MFMKSTMKPFFVLLTALLLSAVALMSVGAQDATEEAESTETNTVNAVANVTYTAEDGTEIGGYLAVPEGVDADLMAMTSEAGATEEMMMTEEMDVSEESAEAMATEEMSSDEESAPDDMSATDEAAVPDADGLYPAVLMVHEWWGLNEDMTEMADILAAEGYVVLAVDVYRGGVGTTPDEAMALREANAPEIVDSDMQVAYDYLAALPYVDTANIGVIGFCYGGGVALRHATQNAEIAATVDLYGETIDDPNGFGALLESGSEVLGIFGSEDQQFPAERVEAFDMALTEAGIVHAVTVYEGVAHAFVDAETLETSEQAQDAWDQVLTFFEENLKDEASMIVS